MSPPVPTPMKIEKLLLTVLCSIACAWVVWTAVGVAGLAQHQGPPSLAGGLELLAFAAASAIPLVHTWWRSGRRPWLLAVWAPCLLYECFLATRVALHQPLAGAARLLLWLAIAVLVARQSHQEQAA
ncbi:hypothetical protein Oter_4299 [Opitutus terrae PB90-1]|uniref:DUF2069 domain-containing protein n=2 Tax=Opitutus terrae TaxID=107709 RepID=B1ZP83_OPITP|nr:hypothetical protein Oter_4299 [Opitutus terrae PB90-1]